MTITRKQRSPEFKAKVALEAIKESKTVNEIAGAYQVHTGQVTQWKTQLKEGVVQIFSQCKQAKERKRTGEEAALYEQIGRLTCENNWLKKKLGVSS
jgi:transposase-like protein